MKTLKPIYDHDSYSAPIAKEIYYALYEAIFAPLFQIMENKELRNAKLSWRISGDGSTYYYGDKKVIVKTPGGGGYRSGYTTLDGDYAVDTYHTLAEAKRAVEARGEYQNAKISYLVQALRSGKLQYVEGFFIGPLNSNLSKELRGMGAIYNKVKKAYKLEVGNLPQDILLAVSEGNIKAKEQLKKVEDFLKAIEGNTIKTPDLEPFFGNNISKLNEQFSKTTKRVTGRTLEIPLDQQRIEKLKESYTENLGLYIQKWYDEQILRLRQKVSQNVQQGFRAENLIRDIQAEKKVSHNKAKFLAKQETSLMVSKYRELRYEEVGVTKYMWSTSHDSRVRDSHKHLQGKIFRFDQPPVTNLATGARNNPGEDFGCRCIATPILPGAKTLEIEHAGK